MNILVIGSGGREHAICQSFSRSNRITRLCCANGNAGIGQIAECVPIKPDDIAALANFARDNKIDLSFVGGESPLALGIVDEFESLGLRIIGPSKTAARLEASKSFSKDFMVRHGVPTAKFRTAHSPADAVSIIETGVFGDPDTPLVVKADGLAAGKGVVVAASRAEALSAIQKMENLVGSTAAETIVLEECLIGTEVSLLMLADGEDFALMPPTRDHKRIGEGDTGPNTGGMGTITDTSLLSAAELANVTETIIKPTLRGCVSEGMRYRGILFLGLMMTVDGPKLLEYNVRFGDPETQAILVRLETDFLDICEAMLNGTLAKTVIKWRSGSSSCIVLASRGYPDKAQTGDVIRGLDAVAKLSQIDVFHAGTAKNDAGEIITSGGRVLGVTATGNDLTATLGTAYDAVNLIDFDGMQYRRDIGRVI